MEKLITDYSRLTDDELDATASGAKTSLTGNTHVTLTTGDHSAFDTAVDDYHTKKAAVATGGTPAVNAKNAARVVLVGQMKKIATLINLQTTNLTNLQSTGLILAKHSTHPDLPQPTALVVNKAANSNEGEMHAAVAKPVETDHGTVFAYQEMTNPPGSDFPEDWQHQAANGHSTTLKLSAGHRYRVAAAYKGKEGTDLHWCPFISIWAS